MNDLLMLEEFIREALLDEAKRGRKKGKSKSKSGGLSAKTKKTLKKKADERGFTPGSVYQEYRKGLAAFYTSGSR